MIAPRTFPVLDAAIDCVILMDSAGLVVDVNASGEAIFGRRRDEMIGRVLADQIIPERFREAHRHGLARYLETGVGKVIGTRIEIQALRADGTEFPVELAISTIVVDGEELFVGFLRDLTERFRLDAERESARSALAAALARLERLQSSTAALASARTVEAIASAVLNAGAEALGADTGLFVRPLDHATLGIVATLGVPDSLRSTFQTVPRDAPLPTAAAFRSGEPEWVEDEAAFRERYGAAASTFRSASAAAALPLRIGEKVVGAVGFHFDDARRFAAADRALLESFATQAADALDRVLIYEQEIAARRRLEALADVTSRLTSTFSQAEVAQAVIDGGMRAMSADTGMLYRVEPDGSLALVNERGCPPSLVDGLRRIDSASNNATLAALRAGRTLWVETEAEYQTLFPGFAALEVEGPRAKAFWSVPLIVEGEPIGLLAMGFYAPRRFSGDDRVFVETLARNAAQALLRAQRLEGEMRAHRSLETTLISIGDAVIVVDTARIVTFLNPIAERLTGWKKDEALGRAADEVFRIVHEHTREPVRSPLERVLAEGVVVGLANHTLLLAKDGREVPIDDSAAPIRDADDSLLGVILVFRDVTARQRAEDRRAFLTQATSELASSLDYEGTLKRVAQLAVPKLADWCSIEILEPGQTAARQLAVAHVDPQKVAMAAEFGQRYPPDPNAATGVPNVLRTGVSELYTEISEETLRAAAIDEEHLRLLHALKLESAMVVPLIARGRTVGAITFVYAESGRRYSADDLLFAEDLARRAATAVDNSRLYAEAVAARKKTEEALRARESFLSMASHELRTPVTGLSLQLQSLLRMMGKPADPKRFTSKLEAAQNQLRRLTALIDDLLDVSRLAAGRLPLHPEDVDAAALVHEVVARFEEELSGSGSSVRLEVDPPVFVRADRARFDQVLTNLLSNAIKYGDGKPIEISVRAEDDRAVVVVRDQGIGISPASHQIIFQRFERVAEARGISGLGLGLWIVRNLLELMEGSISVESAVDAGSAFTVTLPLAGARSAPDQKQKPPLV